MRKIFVMLVFIVFLSCGIAMADLTDNGDGTVTDTVTGLMWQKATAPGEYTWQNALSYCENLTLAGYMDWRLPNRNELHSLVDYSSYNPAIDPLLASDIVFSYYWSSTTYASSTNLAWLVGFHCGYINYYSKTLSYYVRAVRSEQSGLAALYFPHVATSIPWQTEIAIINTSSDQTVTGTLRALSNEGQLIETKDITLPARGRRQINVADEFTNHINIGYIILEADSAAVQGYTKFYQEGVYRAAIPAVKEVNTSDIYIPHIASNAQWWTGISMVNTTSARKDLTITFNNGQTVPYSLNANEHKAFTIESLFNNQPQPDIQSAVINNANGVIGLELFGSIGGGNQLEGILLSDDTASTIYYPHVASDNIWWTSVVAYPTPGSDYSIGITSYSADGTLLYSNNFSVAGYNRYIGVVSNLGLPAQTAWFKIDSSRPLTGFELFGTFDGNQLAAYAEGGGTGAKSGVFAKIEKNGWTGIAFVNTEASAASITLTAYSDNGSAVATRVLPVGGYAKVVNLAEAIFSQNISGATYIAYSSDKNVVGFQLNGSSDGTMLDGLPGLSGLGGTIPSDNSIRGTVSASFVNGIRICVDETVGTTNEICTTSAVQGNFTLQNAEGKQLTVFITNAKIGTISAGRAVDGLNITPAILADGDTTKEIKIKALLHQAGVKTGSGNSAIYDLSGIKFGDIDLGALNAYLNGTSKTITIGAIVVNSDNEIGGTECDFTHTPLIREVCFGGIGPGCDGVQIIGAPLVKFTPDPISCYVDGLMSVGSILHDICCVATKNAGFSCKVPYFGGLDCKREWEEAVANTMCSLTRNAPRQWSFVFGPYYAGDDYGTNMKLTAPDGTRVNPEYQYICRSGRCEIDAQCNTIINTDNCGDYCVCSSSVNILVCPDIAGKWNFTNSGVVTCSGDGETDTEYPSGSGTACITQKGCEVSWVVPGSGYSRSGTIEGNSIQNVSGIFVVPLVEGVNVTQNSYTASGTISIDENTITLNGNGSASGSYEGTTFSCSGTDTSTYTRVK